MNPKPLEEFLIQKGQEYAPFCPNRAIEIFKHFKQDFLQGFKPKVLHIIGTNGKGSTGRYLALGLRDYQVLHFSSPHLFAFNERFYRNGGLVSMQELQQIHQELMSKAYMQECSYFEYATFLALRLARDLDFLILEAGLGGEFDSTNVIEDKISVFTQIGMDHQEILGERLEQIARTKLNAMGKTAFLGIQKYPKVLEIAEQIAHTKQTQLFVLPQIPQEDFLSENLKLASAVLDFLGVEKKPSKESLDLQGRFQRYASNIILDVGHNVDGARAIVKLLAKHKIHLIYNAYKQKDIRQVLEVLKPIIEEVQIIQVKNTRIIPQDSLEQILRDLGIKFGIFKGDIEEDKEYLVFGSFSVVEAFLKQRERDEK